MIIFVCLDDADVGVLAKFVEEDDDENSELVIDANLYAAVVIYRWNFLNCSKCCVDVVERFDLMFKFVVALATQASR